MAISNNKNIFPLRKRCSLGCPLSKEFTTRRLTRREFEVLEYILLGYTAKKIGRSLDLSYRTIEAYIDTLKLKMGCESKSEIIEKVIKEKLIDVMCLQILKDK